jgi:hypothetical protein
MVTGINIYFLLIVICATECVRLTLFVGTHPFFNTNGTLNTKRQGKGEYEKVKEGRYSSALINLMERMMDVV